MNDDRGQAYRFEPYADHLMFVVSDAEATEGVVDGGTWAQADASWRIGVERHAIAVGTARYDFVPVTLTIRSRAPEPTPFDSFDHVVEADIAVPSGKLAVTGGTQLASEVQPVSLTAGIYRLRVTYAQTDHRPADYSDSDPGDHLEYRVTMWPVPSENTGVTVLKQGPSPWAY